MNEVFKKYFKEIVAGLIFLFMYLPVFVWMWDRWWARDSYYSHGILIPFVSAYLIWQMKDELKKIPRQESVWGIRLILIGIALHLLSALFRIYFSSGFSMLIVLAGMVLHFFGREVFKKIAFPIAFLFFMIPLPMVVIANISFKLKLFAAKVATFILNSMGITAIQQGSIIHMRSAHVIVDDVCSGVRSLVSLAALGSIAAYWMKSSMGKRLILFISTVPIAIITNVCRVIILSCVSEIWGAEHATGFLHDATGFMVFALACVLLYFVKRLIE